MSKLNVTINRLPRKDILSFWIDRCPELRVPKYISVGTGNKQHLYRDYLKRTFNTQKYGTKLLIWMVHMVRCNEDKGGINIIGDCVYCKRHNHAQILIEFINEHYDVLKTLIGYIFAEGDGYLLPVKLPALKSSKQAELEKVLTQMKEQEVIFDNE